jgi:hypothetical protein
MTFDGQSFLLDGRRVWLVSGSIHMARVPRAEWASRILAAKHAGLNCIETSVVWSRHEPRHGQFDFTGENDVREFVRLIHAAGMYCILRPGPFVDGGYDMGGLPPWLSTTDNLKLRTANQPFLEACSRYITALAGQLRDMQVNSPKAKGADPAVAPGPIVLLQTEHGFTCGDDHLAVAYLGELDRYFRESGFTVPIINSNDLWQSVEGQIDGWSGYDQLLSHLRQLGSIRPAQPRMVIDFRVGQRTAFGAPAPAPRSPGAVMRRLAEVLAAGGQFNIEPFCGGSYPGFLGGRDASLGPAGFVTTSNDCGPGGTPLSETGHPTPMYSAVRRVCTFASRFSRVLSHLDPARQPVALMPETRDDSGKDSKTSSRVAVLHAVGSQGGVVFVFGDDAGHNSREPMSLLLPDGATLPVDLGQQSVVWCLLETRLSGRANLDYCNLCALALIGKVFICFGAAGARAMLSINGSPLETTVPTGKTPLVHEHEGVTVVIASQEQVDHIHFDDAHVYLGVAGLDALNRPIAIDDAKTCTVLDTEGKAGVYKFTHHAAPKKAKPHLSEFVLAGLSAHVEGTSPRFANINKPSDLVSLGAPYGYGWYRIKIPSGSSRKAKVMFPHAGHRLHVFNEGEPVALLGMGTGASTTAALPLKKGSSTFVVLAENAGRVSCGADLGELTGIYNHAWEVEALKVSKPKLGPADPADPLAFRAPLWRMHRDDRTDSQRLTWTIDHRSKSPLIVEIGPFDAGQTPEREGGLLILNGKPIHFFQQGGLRPIFIDPAILHKGKNEFQITLMGSTSAFADALTEHVHFYEAVEQVTAKAEWAFAKWELPGKDAWGKSGKHAHGQPAFWRAQIAAIDVEGSIVLDLAGMSKGQIYVGGKHLGRYWVATASGKKVPPQHRYIIPRAMLTGEQTDLVLFDEHGHAPTKVRVLNDTGASALGD